MYTHTNTAAGGDTCTPTLQQEAIHAPQLNARTLVDDGCEDVVHAVQAQVDGEQEAHQHLVCKHDDRLHHVEGVAAERGGGGGPAGREAHNRLSDMRREWPQKGGRGCGRAVHVQSTLRGSSPTCSTAIRKCIVCTRRRSGFCWPQCRAAAKPTRSTEQLAHSWCTACTWRYSGFQCSRRWVQ